MKIPVVDRCTFVEAHHFVSKPYLFRCFLDGKNSKDSVRLEIGGNGYERYY